MKLPADLYLALGRLRDEAARLRQRLRDTSGSQALSTFLRPNMGPTPAPLRRVLEPVVAVAALSLLATLLAAGALSFATLVLVAALVYAILTQVFGLELGLAT
jgi:hypothetical protein